MDNFNRVVSFILGLIVVIVFLIIINRRFGFFNSWFGTKTASAITPTVTVTPSPTPSAMAGYVSPTPRGYQKPVTPDRTVQGVKNIPSTGAETIMLPLAFSALLGGFYLKNKDRKNS